MSIFTNGNMNNDVKDKQVLTTRAIDEYKTFMLKQGYNDFKFDDIPNVNIHDKISLKNPDKQTYTNSSKHIRDDFYKLRNSLIHNDGMGINRFYKLLKDPQANVIENYNGDCISRIGQNTTQLYKDLCN
tara:strand:- start:122 stop:508 length:387 start_codon:yes stop_codon:yes gene_type:complete